MNTPLKTPLTPSRFMHAATDAGPDAAPGTHSGPHSGTQARTDDGTAWAADRPVRVSIVVKALNEGPHIYRALASALDAVAELGGEVILADSGSTDDTLAQAARLPVRIVQLADPRERRCGIGPELGWRQAQGEYVYLMDGDMVLEPGFLGPALGFLARHPEVAGVGGQMIERSLASIEYRERERRAREDETHRRPGPVSRLDGGGLYRRVAIAEVDYLSDRNLHSYEELDLALRLRARGWRRWASPGGACCCGTCASCGCTWRCGSGGWRWPVCSHWPWPPVAHFRRLNCRGACRYLRWPGLRWPGSPPCPGPP